jgi:hypothetical protein
MFLKNIMTAYNLVNQTTEFHLAACMKIIAILKTNLKTPLKWIT